MSAARRSSYRPMNIDVLVIDDDEALRDSVKVLLEAEGLIVRVDEEGTALKKSIFEARFVVLDLQLEEGLSFKLMELITSSEEPSKIVVITGSRDQHLHDRAYACGAELVLEKPFLPSELIQFIKSDPSHLTHT